MQEQNQKLIWYNEENFPWLAINKQLLKILLPKFSFLQKTASLISLSFSYGSLIPPILNVL